MHHPERMNDLAEQLRQEHRAGMAEDKLAYQRRQFMWDIEGWSATDQLLLYIPGVMILRIPVDEVARLGAALLAEHESHTREDRHEGDGFDEGDVDPASDD